MVRAFRVRLRCFFEELETGWICFFASDYDENILPVNARTSLRGRVSKAEQEITYSQE